MSFIGFYMIEHLLNIVSIQLNVLELFLDCITEPNEKLVEFGIGGICNACASYKANLPEIERWRTKEVEDGVWCSFHILYKELLIEMIEKQQLERHDHQELPCIIYDPLVHSAEVVAHHLKLPSIMLQTSSVAFLFASYVCPKIQKEGYTPFQESKSLELVPELYPLRFKDLPVFDVKSVDDFLQFVTTVLNLRTSCMILNSIDCLEQKSLAQLRQKSPF
ncbi:hypothetical protein Dsin_019528 [Dipteronia sinensis]|uniref:Uncharacterized protein n=1 Tax=Dipteronia sinensis TaxID=43782 RepID=A0AAE0E2L6_9ROSI|nr:hypothetical protein Dsin_019528 [Dipteronia sinensis]